MMKGLSLTELAAKIEGAKALKRDYIVDSPALHMEVDDDKKIMLAIGEQDRVGVLDIAHQQLGTELAIPAKYYERMRTEDPELLALNVNSWLVQAPKKRMVRTIGGDARAYLSNKFNRIEHEEIASVALPVLLGIPDVQVVSSEITERRLYIQAVAPRVQGEVKVGDVVQAGVVISNSEVGMGSVSVAAMYWRLWCLNGAIDQGSKFRAMHVGREIVDTEALWQEDTKKADDRLILLKVRDMIAAAVDAARFREKLDKMSALTTGKVTGDPAKAVLVLAAKVGATEDETGGILRALIDGGDLSAWGLLNAVTAQAHTAKSYDRAVEFGAAGGMLIDLPRDEWRKVLEAA